jgi:uncharacterized membrane protein YgdD (TMEM256/DUF423 family)
MTNSQFHDRWSRATVLVGAVCGGAGVALAAAASHGGDQRLLGNASTICLAHAPVLVALGLFGLRQRRLSAAAVLMGAGTLVFAADLVSRHLAAHGLFPGAAPAGGLALILGWGALAIAPL